MKNKILVFSALIFVITHFLLLSCNESNPLQTENKIAQSSNLLSLQKRNDNFTPPGKLIGYETIIENEQKKEVPIYEFNDSSLISTRALNCRHKRVYRRKFDHYNSIPGKNLGIWNTKSYSTNLDLKNKFGFNSFLVSNESQKNALLNIGIDYSNIMVKVNSRKGNYIMPNGTFAKYYIDEPYERHSITLPNIINLSNEIFNLNHTSELFISSYKRSSEIRAWYNQIIRNYNNTRMMCDQYYNGYFWYGHDQTGFWQVFKETFGNSNVSNWVHLVIDGKQDDFDMLFDKANRLGINTLWVFAGDANNNWPGINDKLTLERYNKYLPSFTATAYHKGWLKKVYNEYHYWYKCPDSYSNPCFCKENDIGWELRYIQYIGTIEY